MRFRCKFNLLNLEQLSEDHLALVWCSAPEPQCVLSTHSLTGTHTTEYPRRVRHCFRCITMDLETAIVAVFDTYSVFKFPLPLDSAMLHFPSFPSLSAKFASFSISFSNLALGAPWGSVFALCSFSAPVILNLGYDHNLWGEAQSMNKSEKLHK